MPRNSDMLSSVADTSTRSRGLAENLRRPENYLYRCVLVVLDSITQPDVSPENKTTEGDVTVMIHRRW
jgi:hypothetical protein